MSEYQYYEFRAVDRPLTSKEQGELRSLSTRAEITSTSFTNTYHWGDFKGKPEDLMDRYFDAFVYVANWGTHRLMFRIPEGLLGVEAASAYCDEETLSVTPKSGHVVLEYSSREEDEPDDEWIDGEEWMPSLISIRDELMRGDLRALYLGWLASLWPSAWDGEDEEGVDDDRLEPPVPPGLAKLSAAQRSLAEFLRVDDELIEAAAAGSAGEPPAEPSHVELAGWIQTLPEADKDAYLLRFLAEEGDLRLRAEMSKRSREAAAPKGTRPKSDAGRRSVKQLLDAARHLSEEKGRKAAERKAEEQARQGREKAQARSKYLDELALRETATWREVEQLITTKQPKGYDRAVSLLVDLRDLAGRSGQTVKVKERVSELRRRHGNKPSFLKRLDLHDFKA